MRFQTLNVSDSAALPAYIITDSLINVILRSRDSKVELTGNVLQHTASKNGRAVITQRIVESVSSIDGDGRKMLSGGEKTLKWALSKAQTEME